METTFAMRRNDILSSPRSVPELVGDYPFLADSPDVSHRLSIVWRCISHYSIQLLEEFCRVRGSSDAAKRAGKKWEEISERLATTLKANASGAMMKTLEPLGNLEESNGKINYSPFDGSLLNCCAGTVLVLAALALMLKSSKVKLDLSPLLTVAPVSMQAS